MPNEDQAAASPAVTKQPKKKLAPRIAKPEAPRKSRPTKALPTDRIAVKKQLEILRAYAVASNAGAKAVSVNEAAAIVGLNPSTISLAHPFFIENGFMQRQDGGFMPAAELLSFARAYEWNPETATHKLAPIIIASWFGQALMPKLTFGARSESEAIQDLATACATGRDYESQLGILLDYLEAVGLAQRDGSQIRASKTGTSSTPQPESRSAAATPTPSEGKEPARGAITTTFAQPTQGVVQFHVSVKVDMAEFAGWPADRITAFFSGIAQVLAAKGAIEKGATED